MHDLFPREEYYIRPSRQCVPEAELLRCWRDGMNTHEIAQKYFLQEHDVHRRLTQFRERIIQLRDRMLRA